MRKASVDQTGGTLSAQSSIDSATMGSKRSVMASVVLKASKVSGGKGSGMAGIVAAATGSSGTSPASSVLGGKGKFSGFLHFILKMLVILNTFPPPVVRFSGCCLASIHLVKLKIIHFNFQVDNNPIKQYTIHTYLKL